MSEEQIQEVKKNLYEWSKQIVLAEEEMIVLRKGANAINQLQQENKQLKEQIILLKSSKPMLELTKYYDERDLYKSVIDEIRELVNWYDFDNYNYGKSRLKEDKDKILQIIDKVNFIEGE